MSEQQLIGQVEEAVLAEWKRKHGVVHGIKRKGRIAYFRELKTMAEFNAYYASINDEKVSDRWVRLTELTYLGGCDELISKDNPQDLMKVFTQLSVLVAGEDAEVVNL